MNITDVNKVAIDAEAPRNIISSESSTIIKLREAQNAAYWDVQTRLAGVEEEHERLQQNMLNVQMKYEKLSATYQDELRQRPELLNKLASTRELCDVLEESACRVHQSLRRSAALAQCYASAAQRLKDLHAQHKHTKNIDQANEKVHQLTEKQHNDQLLCLSNEAKRQAEGREEAARAQLSATAGKMEEMRAKCELMAEKSYSYSAELIVQKRYIAELKVEADAAATAATALQDKLQKRVDTVSQDLKTSEARVESASKIAEMQKGVVQNLQTTGNNWLVRELALSKANTETLNKQIQQKEYEMDEFNVRFEEARRVLEETREAIVKKNSELTEQLEAERKARAEETAAAKNALDAQKSRSAAAAAATERTLAERTAVAAGLMQDVVTESTTRVRAEAKHSAVQAQLELAAQARNDLINKLQAKEKEVSAQMKTNMESRKEKEWLQENIRNLQDIKEKMHKELKVAAPAEPRAPPEHVDNARHADSVVVNKVACPNSKIKKHGLSRSRSRSRSPLSQSEFDDMLYHLLSESSDDGDMLNPVQRNVLLEAPPQPTSRKTLKHNRELPAAAAAAEREELSTSQVRAAPVDRGRRFFSCKPRLEANKKSKK